MHTAASSEWNRMATQSEMKAKREESTRTSAKKKRTHKFPNKPNAAKIAHRPGKEVMRIHIQHTEFTVL